jgi:hypothetical protein
VTLLSATVGVTLLLTVAAFFVSFAELGPGALLLLAMLGPDAAWLLPGMLARTMAPGLLGGALLSAATAETAMRPAARDVLGATFVLTCVTLYFVGWLAPAAVERAGARVSRFVDAPAVEASRPVTVSPAAQPLPELVQDSSGPARSELWRRLRLVATCAVFGLLAAAVAGSGVRVSTAAAVGVTAVAFIWQMQGFVDPG